jgi:hypothetical protein
MFRDPLCVIFRRMGSLAGDIIILAISLVDTDLKSK